MNRWLNNRSSSNLVEFTDNEIREQLEYLGFKNVPKDKFNQFKIDLEKLITQEVSINSTNSYSDLTKSKSNNYQLLSARDNSSPNKKDLELNERLTNNKNKRVTFPNESQIVVQDDLDQSDQSFVSITTTNSIVDNKILKRKIIRKTNGSSNGQKSSFDLDEANPRLNRKVDSNENVYSKNEPNYHSDDQVHSDDEQYIQLNEYYPPINYPMKSFIRSQSSTSLRSDSYRSNQRSNSVQKFQEYQKMWNKHKAPGEKKHSDLRWSIREQMLEKQVIVKKQQKTFNPNTYIIPTEKKRQELRWAVRSALANQI